MTPIGEVWVCVRNNSPVGWNRFESPSLSDSENLTEQRQHDCSGWNQLMELDGYDDAQINTPDMVTNVC